MAVVQEAYVAGVSTRKVDQVVESLGLRVSKSEVSRICQGLDEQVEAFRSRPLEGHYPYLFLDAKVERVIRTMLDGWAYKRSYETSTDVARPRRASSVGSRMSGHWCRSAYAGSTGYGSMPT